MTNADDPDSTPATDDGPGDARDTDHGTGDGSGDDAATPGVHVETDHDVAGGPLVEDGPPVSAETGGAD